MVKKGIQRFKEVSMLELICYLRPENPPESNVAWEDSGDTPLTKAKRNALVRGGPASPRSSVVALLCRPGEMLGEAITELGSLIEAKVIRTAALAVFNCPKPGAHNNYNDWQCQRGSQESLTLRESRGLIEYGAPRGK